MSLGTPPRTLRTSITCRIAAKRLTLTGGADRVGVRLPDSGQTSTSPTSRRWPQGRTYQIAAKRLTLTRGAGPDAGVACGTLCPTSYSVARTSMAATPWPAPRRIAARRLTLTGGADRVGVRLPAPALRSQATPVPLWTAGVTSAREPGSRPAATISEMTTEAENDRDDDQGL